MSLPTPANTSLRHAMAVAACSFALSALAQQPDGTTLLQVTPAGSFNPADGREMDSPPWWVNQASATKVIERFRARRTPPVIDYEHQTLNKEKNGQPAPAAGRMLDLQWIEGKGLYAVAKLTQRAREHIDAEEYLYFSPVFEYSRATGEVLAIHMGALTNNPAIDGMEPLSLLAAATAAFLSTTQQESTVNLLQALIASLGLPENTTEATAVTALTAMGPLKDLGAVRAQATAACTALALPANATADAVTAACSSLRSAGGAAPDPAKYVPVGVVEELRTNLAALSSKVQGDAVEKAVSGALEDGRLLPAMAEWARDLGKTNMAALTAYLEKAQPLPALAGTQTGGKKPGADGGNASTLTADEVAVAAACGLTPEQFAKAKA